MRTARFLSFADSNRFCIVAENRGADTVISRLSHVMQLSKDGYAQRRILIRLSQSRAVDAPPVYNARSPGHPFPASLARVDGQVSCQIHPVEDRDCLYLQLAAVALLVVREVQDNHGLLVHGALAEYNDKGVILAGPGGVGKTTACQRLSPPWRVLSDDATLVVRDENGAYWAHPWPTWSRFYFGGRGGTWPVERAVKLRGIFFLSQASKDVLSVVGPGHGSMLLIESAEQAALLMPYTSTQDLAFNRTQRFNNACELAKSTNTYKLDVCLAGSFWRLVEETLRD